MTTNNNDISNLDAYLDQFTPMDQVDMSPRPGHESEDRSIEYAGTQFEWATNIASTTERQGYMQDGDSITQRLYTPVMNQVAFLHVLAEKGFVAATEDVGRALTMHGIPQSISTVELYRHPETDDPLGRASVASAASRMLEGEHTKWGMVADRLIDVREARAALDLVLAQPEHAALLETSRAHHERVFGDPRLGGHASRTVEEVGGVPDPADPRYLDYI